MEEKRNKFKVLVINEAIGMRMEMPVSKGMADRVLKDIVNFETARKNNNSSPKEVEKELDRIVEGFQAPEEEYPEPTGRQEPVEKGLLPKKRVKAVRIGGWIPKGGSKRVPINFIRVAKAVMNELSKIRTKSIRVDTLLKAVVRRYGTRAISGNYYSVINNLANEMGYTIVRMGKHNRLYFNGVPKTGIKPLLKSVKIIKKGKRREFIAEKLLELSKEGKRKIKVDKFIKFAGFNYSTGQLREAIYKEASELGFEITRMKGSRNVLIILSKKEGKPERVWKQTKEEQKTKIYIEIKKRLLKLSNQGIKRIKQREIAFEVGKSRHPSAYIYKKIAEAVSDLGFKIIDDKGSGKPKVIILKEEFKPSPRVKNYSSGEIKIKNKLLELSGTGKKEVFEGDLLKSIGVNRAGYMYKMLDDVAKDMGFEVIKLGKGRSFRKKIILKKEEPKGSRAYMSIYAKTLNEWEKIPTPFNLRQATFKLFGVMGGYNYNLTSMNVGQALNKLVRQGKLVRKKVLGTVQVRGKKGWGKEMWLYDLPKEGEEPQEVAPEPPEDIDLPVVSEDTLIAVFNQHIEISPKTFCGFYTKTGQPVTERQARFLFYFIRDNIGFIQGITDKKIVVGGYGQWQTIKIR